jgi:hypothetical protein
LKTIILSLFFTLLLIISPVMAFQEVTEEAPIEISVEEVLEKDTAKKPKAKKPKAKKPEVKKPEVKKPPVPVVKKDDPYPHVIYTLKGDRYVGKLLIEEIEMQTAYGPLKVPLSKIQVIIPGLKHQGDYLSRIAKLIDDLSHSNFKKREEAQQALARMGGKIEGILKKRLEKVEDEDFDAELKNRINTLLEEIEEPDDEDVSQDELGDKDLVAEDRVVTESFVILGSLKPSKFSFKKKGGILKFSLSDLKKVLLKKKVVAESRTREFVVEGKNFHDKNPKKTNLHVTKGDEITITATGEVTLTPWGSNYKSSPDGNSQAGTLNGTQLTYGMLVAQVGGEKFFKVGKKLTFTAKKSGKVNLGMVMYSSYTKGNYKFPGSYKVKIVVEPKK